MTMCTGISNVMKSDVRYVRYEDEYYLDQTDQPNNIVTSLTPYCQNIHLQYIYFYYVDYVETYWLNIDTTASTNTNINDDTQQHMNISKYFQYPYTSLGIPNDLLFLSLESFQLFFDEREISGSFDKNLTNLNNLKPAYFSLYLGQASLITFNPTIISDINFDIILELNPRLEQLPINLESNEIQFGINFPSRTLDFVETKGYASKYIIYYYVFIIGLI